MLSNLSASSVLPPFVIVGGGLAGCECALILARYGLSSTLYEMKPQRYSPVHTSPQLGELVCSNSFRSNEADRSGVGLLKEEMRFLKSAVLSVAEKVAVPAGKALAVDRELFSARLTRMVEEETRIRVVRKEITSLDAPELAGSTVIIAAGPLASPALAASLEETVTGNNTKRLYFYDAIAPIVSADSIDTNIAFRGSRYGNDGPPPPYADDAPFVSPQAEQTYMDADPAIGPNKDEGDYLNCPMTRPEYEAFYQALLAAEKVLAHDFEQEIHFEGCMPIEALAERGERTLTFGSLKPVGFTDPRTGRRPYALLQLRAENAGRSAYNLVGCQTKMTYKAQAEVFRLIPGLERAEFLRFGSVHRNTYVNAPTCLGPELNVLDRPNIYLAGQITGVEGYVESAACGLWLGLLLANKARGNSLPPPPPGTALGALLQHLRTPSKHFQPSNVHFGLMPDLEEPAGKKNRKQAMAERGRQEFREWLAQHLNAPISSPCFSHGKSGDGGAWEHA